MTPDLTTSALLLRVAADKGTPSYVYFMDGIDRTLDELAHRFGERFKISYAVKSNPNLELLRRLAPRVATFDVSSFGELKRALDVGCDPADLSFSGPAKRSSELADAIRKGCGEFVCESEWELDELNRLAGDQGTQAQVLLRINPKRAPKKFGVRMAGRPSQFGIDEEDLDPVLSRLGEKAHVVFRGFHIFSATNSLSEEGLSENFAIMIDLFSQFSERHDLRPRKLIFGAGFGIPYHAGERALDLVDLSDRINPQIDALKKDPRLADADLFLEMGRFIVGPQGYFLTSVVNEKRSRGTEIRLCDAGMNNHLAAAGHMGMVIRRNYPMWNLSAAAGADLGQYTIVGPLCTTIDTLATKVELPRVRRGDVIAIGSSGAYGATASPTAFISHPVAQEFLVLGTGHDSEIIDVSVR